MAGFEIRHPDVDAPGQARDQNQFETVWEPRGWVKAAPDDDEAPVEVLPGEPLAAVTEPAPPPEADEPQADDKPSTRKPGRAS